MISNKGRYVIIVLAVGLLFYEISEIDSLTNFNFNTMIGFITPILLIIAMVVSIRHVNKHGEN